MISYLLPTRNRLARLRQTLQTLGELDAVAHEAIGGAEVIVVDNASDPPLQLSRTLANGWPLRVIHRPTNENAAARNIGVQQAKGEWIIMLDDDSFPLDVNHIDVLIEAPDNVAAIGADIVLPNGSRESGGLPEVIIGCGAAIRRQAFLDAGGYDPTFDYYAEEYDLCAKLLLNGWRIIHSQRFRVQHEKIATGRDMNRILHRLVRNNCWVAARYAPNLHRHFELTETIARYARIAVKENAASGFANGASDLLQSLQHQPRRAMSQDLFDRFTGMAHARATLERELKSFGSATRYAIVSEGKNAWAVRQALHELHARIVDNQSEADVLVIGTLSPGPMRDAFRKWSVQHRPVLMPWRLHQQGWHDACFASTLPPADFKQ